MTLFYLYTYQFSINYKAWFQKLLTIYRPVYLPGGRLFQRAVKLFIKR